MTTYRSKRRRTYRLRDRALLVTVVGIVFGIIAEADYRLAGPDLADPPAIEGGYLMQIIGFTLFCWLLWGLVEFAGWMDWRASNRSREESERRYGERKIQQAKRPEDVREGLRLIRGGRQ
jgi:hypothetical protein